MSARHWGKILVSTRLEKTVSSRFFQVWMELVQRGLRPGDGALSVRGKVAHKAQNDCVRHLLRGDWDTLLTLDSDADVTPDFLSQFRDYEAGWEYDILQAFYVRRGWPPRAIWMKRNALGDMMEYFIRDPDTVQDVDIAGTHACLIRREVFEGLLGDNDPATFEWFSYPRHAETSEDGAFSVEAKAAGYRIGATTAVRAGHISEITTTWDSYQDYLRITGRVELLDRYNALTLQIAAFTGERPEMVLAKSVQGVDSLRDAWMAANPKTADDERKFYQTIGADCYLYELLAWNCQPTYQAILGQLAEICNSRVLVIGAGLGTEAVQLVEQENAVTCYDLPSRLREFAMQRLGDSVAWAYSPDSFQTYDAIVAIDTLEHIHPAEFPAMLYHIGKALAPNGSLYAHNNWSQQDSYPMHHDNSDTFQRWCSAIGLTQTGQIRWSLSLPKADTQIGTGYTTPGIALL